MDYYNWLFSALVLLVYIIASNLTARLIREIGISKKAAPKRAIYVSKVMNFALGTLSIFTMFFVWGLDYHSILVFGSSIFAVTGVALFAQWSILSNLTASVVIFFTYPARIGDKIRIIDGENTLEGTILDISMFQVLLEDDDQNMISFPNNLLIQKAFVKLNDRADNLEFMG